MKYVGLIGFNSVEYVEKIIELWNEESCVILLDNSTPYEMIVEHLNMVKCNICYIENKIYLINKEKIENERNISFIAFNSNYKEYNLLPDYIYSKYNPNERDLPAVVIFSSGTTGNAKGVELSHYAISKNSDMIFSSMNIDKTSVMYLIKKISHSSTLVGELLVALRNNIKMLVGPTVVPTRVILKNIEDYKVTILCANPNLLKSIVDEKIKRNFGLKSIKKIFTSGDKWYRNDCIHARLSLKDIEIYNMYGLTEAGPRVSMQNKLFCNANSVGFPLDGVKIKILNDNYENCMSNEKGTIFIKTPSKFTNYVSVNCKLRDDTSEWINTGDIGYLDEYGELFIVDRVDDVINLNSHKIYPNDIENRIIKFTNIDACIIVKKSDYKINKEYLICFYVGESIDETKLIRKLKNVCIDYEIPKIYIKLDELPQNINGKRDKIKLMEMME